VEYGDGIDAMVLSPAASGTRYDGSFGRMFWEKGGEALFTWTDGAEQSCVGVD
jgi:membrane-bound inhibitor of C-type lysozyme